MKDILYLTTMIIVECPEHEEECCVENEDYELLIYGEIEKNGVYVNWCSVVSVNEWYQLIRKIIRGYGMFDYASEKFGRISDARLKAIDLVGRSDMCCCPKRIKAYKRLDAYYGIDIYRDLECVVDNNYGLNFDDYTKIRKYTAELNKYLKFIIDCPDNKVAGAIETIPIHLHISC